MNSLAKSDIYNLSAEKLAKLAPIDVTCYGESLFILCNAKDVIVVSDLHPRVKMQLKALEAKARMGMPKPVTIVTEE